MARQAVAKKTSFDPAIQFKDQAPGTTWEGKYVGRRAIPLKVAQANGKTETAVYEIKDGGKSIEFWETAALEQQFAAVPPGAYCWITYQGKISLSNGRSFHDVSVEFDPDYSEDEIPL